MTVSWGWSFAPAPCASGLRTSAKKRLSMSASHGAMKRPFLALTKVSITFAAPRSAPVSQPFSALMILTALSSARGVERGVRAATVAQCQRLLHVDPHIIPQRIGDQIPERIVHRLLDHRSVGWLEAAIAKDEADRMRLQQLR